MNHHLSRRDQRALLVRRGGFTLIEILVALAIFMLMIAIIFVPLRLGFNSFAAGNTKSQVQAAANQTAAKMEAELHTAMYVFPNDAVAGISNRPPYNNVAKLGSGSTPTIRYALPYLRQTVANANACGANTGKVVPVANVGRIDFIPPKRDAGGNIMIPLRAADYVVSYYARRVDPSKPFDIADNPVVMFRAQMPYRNTDGSAYAVSGKPNLSPADSRYPNDNSDYASGGACDSSKQVNTDYGSRWLVQSSNNEPQYLEASSKENPDTNLGTGDANVIAGSHTLLTPRGMEIVAPHASDPTPDYTPTTTFTCEDSNNDGTLDRVTIRLFMASATNDGQTRNGVPLVQSQGLPQVVDLPNAQ